MSVQLFGTPSRQGQGKGQGQLQLQRRAAAPHLVTLTLAQASGGIKKPDMTHRGFEILCFSNQKSEISEATRPKPNPKTQKTKKSKTERQNSELHQEHNWNSTTNMLNINSESIKEMADFLAILGDNTHCSRKNAN